MGRTAADVTIQTPWDKQFPAFAAFEKDLIDDVIPYVESHYSAESGQSNRAYRRPVDGGWTVAEPAGT